jgi:hypothetical protein
MDGTIIQSGRFTSTGVAVSLPIRSDLDWMWVYNYTQIATTQATGRGAKFYWQRGLDANDGFVYYKSDTTDVINLDTSASLSVGGFTLIDSSINDPEAQLTATAVSSAAPAQVSIVAHGYSTGDIVRIYSSNQMPQINGMEFTITVNGANTFLLTNLDTTATTGTWVASTAAFACRIPFNPIFYPRARTITNIGTGATTLVTMAVTHGFTVGQKVRILVPSNFGMSSSINNQQATITAVGTADESGFTNTITLDLDSSAAGTFAWPSNATTKLTQAQIVPMGEDTAIALAQMPPLDVLADATVNRAYIGIRLSSGTRSPAGSEVDVIYWVAGKSYSANQITPILASQM